MSNPENNYLERKHWVAISLIATVIGHLYRLLRQEPELISVVFIGFSLLMNLANFIPSASTHTQSVDEKVEEFVQMGPLELGNVAIFIVNVLAICCYAT